MRTHSQKKFGEKVIYIISAIAFLCISAFILFQMVSANHLKEKYQATKSTISSFPNLQNSHDFAQNFNPVSYKKTNLIVTDEDFLYADRTLSSPFPPCSKLSLDVGWAYTAESKQNKNNVKTNIYYDDFWNLFWIEVVESVNKSSGVVEKGDFYGPYRNSVAQLPTYSEYRNAIKETLSSKSSIIFPRKSAEACDI